MMGFKDMVEEDNKRVFLNQSEFADIHTVKYDGDTYADIPVLLIKAKELKRPVTITDHRQGVHLVTVTAYMARRDLNGVIPEQKRRISIDDGEALGETFFRDYRIVTSDCENGMITLELEAHDE